MPSVKKVFHTEESPRALREVDRPSRNPESSRLTPSSVSTQLCNSNSWTNTMRSPVSNPLCVRASDSFLLFWISGNPQLSSGLRSSWSYPCYRNSLMRVKLGGLKSVQLILPRAGFPVSSTFVYSSPAPTYNLGANM